MVAGMVIKILPAHSLLVIDGSLSLMRRLFASSNDSATFINVFDLSVYHEVDNALTSHSDISILVYLDPFLCKYHKSQNKRRQLKAFAKFN